MSLQKFTLNSKAPESFYGTAGNLGYVRFPVLSAETLDDTTAEQLMKSGYTWVEPVKPAEEKKTTEKK